MGKTEKGAIGALLDNYLQRLKHYHPISWEELPEWKGASSVSVEEVKTREGKLILARITEKETVFLLDEAGKEFSSRSFSEFLNKKMSSGSGTLTFVIGGPFGFSKELYDRAEAQLSLSKMTFSHQMIRVFFAEQLYRAFTILRNEKYHHD